MATAGCMKDREGPEPPTRPQWLISRMVQITEYYGGNPLPGDPPFSRSKLLWEISYNSYYKPVTRHTYVSAARNDTVNLRLSSVDSLVYDGQFRVKEVYTTEAGGTVYARTYHYEGNDTLPFSITYGTGQTLYTYGPDTVRVIFENPKSGLDTTWYVYENDNLKRSITPLYTTEIYDEYDNGPVIESCMNLQLSGIFNLPFHMNGTPRLSKGNWGVNLFMDQVHRSVLYNEQGLPVASTAAVYVPSVERYRSRFEYIATQAN